MTVFKLKTNHQKGMVALPLALVLLALAAVIVIASVGVSLNETVNSSAAVNADIALKNAESGMNDALLKIARDKNYQAATTTITMPVGSVDVAVNVSSGYTSIISVGRAGNSVRTLSGSLSVQSDSITGANWSEI